MINRERVVLKRIVLGYRRFKKQQKLPSDYCDIRTCFQLLNKIALDPPTNLRLRLKKD